MNPTADLVEVRRGHGFGIYLELIGVKSRGAVHIKSPRIDVFPEFHFNHLQALGT